MAFFWTNAYVGHQVRGIKMDWVRDQLNSPPKFSRGIGEPDVQPSGIHIMNLFHAVKDYGVWKAAPTYRCKTYQETLGDGFK